MRGRFITYNGKTQNMRSWAAELGMREGTIARRLNVGLPIEEVLNPANRPLAGISKTKGNFKGRPKGAKDVRKRKPGTGLWQRADRDC